MIRLIFTISLLVLITILFSQNPPNVDWISNYGGSDWCECSSFIQTNDLGYIIVGGSHAFGTNSEDLWVIKLDSNGNFEWENSFGDWDLDEGFDIIETSDGYIMCGRTASFGAGSFDAWVIKIDSSGNEIWSNTYGGVGGESAHSIQETNDGDFVFFGSTSSYGNGSNDVWLVKIDSDGYLIWDQTFGGVAVDEAMAGLQTEDDGYILAGYKRFEVNGDLDAYIIKTDNNGNLIWEQTYGGVGHDQAFAICETNDNEYVIAGSTQSYGSGNYDYWVIKTDNEGNIEWSQTYGTDAEEYAHSIIQTNSGDFVVYGDTYEITHHLKAYKIDLFGEIEWEFSSYEGNISPNISGVIQTNDDGYAFIGYGPGFNCVLIKLQADVNAIFTANPISGYNPLIVSFNDESSGNIISWEWDFNCDGIIDSYIQNPTFTYNQTGTFSVALTVGDGTTEDTMIKEDYITVLEPITADFVGTPLNGGNPLEVSFTDLSAGNPTSWLWDFNNDGFIDSNEQNPVYTYSDVGVYTVSLTVSDGSSNDTEIKTDYISVTSVSSNNGLVPITTQLYSNSPNPFNPMTSIRFDIKEFEKGIFSIFNIKGQLIESNQFDSGQHNYTWDASMQSSGIYLYKLETESVIQTRKMLLLK